MGILETTDFGDLAFLPIEATAPFTETLGWLTDIGIADDGTEDRICLREQPRQSFAETLVARGKLVQDAFNTVTGALSLDWGIAVWSEGVFVGDVADGATGFSFDTTQTDIREGGLALLWGRCSTWALVEVLTLDSGSLTCAALSNAVAGAYVFPLRTGKADSPVEIKKLGNQASIKIRYRVDDNIDLAPAAPEQYLGEDIYYTPTLMDEGGIEIKIMDEQKVVDGELGIVNLESSRDNRQSLRQYGVLTKTREESWDLRLWLHRRKGKYRAFWEPSFLSDIQVVQTGAIGTTLQVEDNSFKDWATERTHIAIKKTDGTWLPRIITASTHSGTNLVTLTLNTSLGIDASEIEMISWLGLKRLDTDSVTLNWIGGGCCSMSAMVLEFKP